MARVLIPTQVLETNQAAEVALLAADMTNGMEFKISDNSSLIIDVGATPTVVTVTGNAVEGRQEDTVSPTLTSQVHVFTPYDLEKYVQPGGVVFVDFDQITDVKVAVLQNDFVL